MGSNGFARLLIAATGLLAIVPGGCIFAADALNPNLLSSLGFDPNAVFPRRGTVIVVFQNQTNAVALFNAFETDDLADLGIDSRNFNVVVDPGESRNEVLDCPIGGLGLGAIGGTGQELEIVPDQAVVVFGADADGVEVAYLGQPLAANQDFFCGDVVIVSLVPIAADPGVGITVQVVRGR